MTRRRRLRLQGRATREEARRFATSCAGALRAWGVPDERVAAAELAVAEACANVARHAYPDATDEDTGEMRLVVTLAGARIALDLCDRGRAFDPTRHVRAPVEPDPDDPASWPEGGMGLSILGEVVDALAYRRVRGENRLAMAIDLLRTQGAGRA